ncbi:MAG: hypothetical protein AMJ64_13315 [Betaproteobacteria bacterium SG8_39]|nr:MAG: hypothetical protein AMJ64_13315 [Betaproteobacteria bacterium SG8_39]
MLNSVALAAPQKPDAADACTIPAEIHRDPPIQGGAPVNVELGILLIDLSEIDDGDQTFRVDVVVRLRWRDPRLGAKVRGGSFADCRLELKDVWNPDIRPLNVRTQHRVLGEALRVDASGTVVYERHVQATFASRFHLREFPFDVQSLRIQLASFSYGRGQVRIVPHAFDEVAGREISVAGWRMLDEHPDAGVGPIKVGPKQFTRVDHVLLVAREPGYFLWNFVLPLGFIVLMAWSVFWLDPKAWGPQIGIATASAFTLVAFLIALRSRLPPVPYLTRLDELILFSTILVFVALAQVVVTSRFAETDRLELARRLDAYGRWIYIGALGMVVYMTLVR